MYTMNNRYILSRASKQLNIGYYTLGINSFIKRVLMCFTFKYTCELWSCINVPGMTLPNRNVLFDAVEKENYTCFCFVKHHEYNNVGSL